MRSVGFKERQRGHAHVKGRSLSQTWSWEPCPCGSHFLIPQTLLDPHYM